MVRALLIDDKVRAAIEQAIEKAAANPMSLELAEELAMNVPQGKLILNLDDRKNDIKRPESIHVDIPVGFRASITFENQPAGLCRHLSVSVDTLGSLPNMIAFDMIAEAFGFQAGAPRQMWVEEFSCGHEAINLVELVTAKTPKEVQ